MTTKSRTNINFTLFILACICFFSYLAIVIFQAITGSLNIPEPYFPKQPSRFFIFGYNPIVVLCGVFIELLYVMIVSFITFRSFAKTQSSIILFFMFYLVAVFMDTFRVLIPLFHIYNSYSQGLMAVGNSTIFAHILSPLSLLVTAILHMNEQHQNSNKYSTILLFSALILAVFIPLNSTKILPNFTVAHGYSKAIFHTSSLFMILAVITLVISNYKSEKNQLTAIGFALFSAGTSFVFYSYSLVLLFIGFTLLGVGTTLYVMNLHNDYLMA